MRPMTVLALDLNAYAPIVLLIVMAIGFAVGNLVLSRMLGPGREGKTKGETYESGMKAIGSTRKRFNVRFYLIAMVFLVFDIEIIFLYPWAVTFPNLNHAVGESGVWLARIFFFIFTTLVAYVYGYRKGVFKFD